MLFVSCAAGSLDVICIDLEVPFPRIALTHLNSTIIEGWPILLLLKEEPSVIVRSWHGIVPIENAGGFRDYILNTGVAEAKSTLGNLGAYIYSQPQGRFEHSFMVSYWESIASIQAFASSDINIAVTYPEDDDFSLISDPIVLHHEIKEIPSGFPVF